MADLISTQTIEEKLKDMKAKLEAFKGFVATEDNLMEQAEIVRLLTRYQISEFAELFEQDSAVISLLEEIVETNGELIQERLGEKLRQMFSNKARIEDEFQGFGSEETLRLCEFNFNFYQELMVNYGNQQKIICENKADENNEDEKAEAKKLKTRRIAQEKSDKLNDMLYNSVI